MGQCLWVRIHGAVPRFKLSRVSGPLTSSPHLHGACNTEMPGVWGAGWKAEEAGSGGAPTWETCSQPSPPNLATWLLASAYGEGVAYPWAEDPERSTDRGQDPGLGGGGGGSEGPPGGLDMGWSNFPPSRCSDLRPVPALSLASSSPL